jgi:hypothetical protein
MTDLDAFQRIWAEQDAKLNDMLRLNTNLLQAAALNRARPAFQRLERRQWAAVVIWAMILLALGGFAADHRAEPVLCLSAILAAGYTIWMLSASLRLAIMLRSLDFAAPVACLLDQAAAVRVHRINQTRWGVLSGSAVWAPFFVVVCQGVFNVEITAVPWLAANIILGLGLIPLWQIVARRFGGSMARSPAVQRLVDDIAGRTLNEATQALRDLAVFKADPAA